jgi:hypothetical protein
LSTPSINHGSRILRKKKIKVGMSDVSIFIFWVMGQSKWLHAKNGEEQKKHTCESL